MHNQEKLTKLLCFMARMVVRKYQPLVIGITGSTGKSSVKEAVALVLSESYSVRKAEGNYNNEINIPLAILDVESRGNSFLFRIRIFFKWLTMMLLPLRYPDILVLEIGGERPGVMNYLLSLVPVRIGIITQVSASHRIFFESVTAVAKEKGKLIALLPENGFAILNADDKRVLKMQEKTKAKVLTYGFDEQAMVRADHLLFYREIKRAEGFSFKLNYDGKSVPVRLPKVIAKHHISAVLAAVAVGVSLKMNLVEIAGELEKFEPLPGRLRLIPGRNSTFLLDDTYSASPTSTRAALAVLCDLMAPRKIVVLGDMLELGPDAFKEHADLADTVIAADAHIVMAVGKHMRAFSDALLQKGYPRKQLLWIADTAVAAQMLSKIIRFEDLILIKGSQEMRMEKIVETLLVDPEDATTLLCRQTEEWRMKPFSPPAEWREE